MKMQYNAIKAEHPDCLLFYRLGDFYEMFDEDARTASRELDLKAHVGVSLSRDAFYRQNPQLNETLRDVQAVAVSEMECDTVFVVGTALNVRTGAVVGTDSNIYLSVQPTQAEKEALYMKSEERTIAIALKACVLLAE